MSDLIDRAKQAAAEVPDSDWGYRLELDPGTGWEGRWLGEDVRRGGEFGDQRVFLLVDRDGARCHIYAKSRLARHVDAVLPAQGDNVGIWRGPDEYSNNRTIHAYGFSAEGNPEPLPEPPEAAPTHVQQDFGNEPPW